MRSFSRGAWVLVAGASLLVVVAFAGRAVWTPTRGPAPAPVSASRTVAFPSAEPSFDLSKPLTVTEVSAGHKVTLTGTGPRQVAFTVTDASMVVAHLDCRLCEGLLRYVSGDSDDPLLTGLAPAEDEHLLATGDRRRGLLVLDTIGRWTITLTSTLDLPVASGAVSGSGPKVVVLGGPGAGFTEATGANGVRTRGFDPTSRTPLASGLPAVVEVTGAGTWRLEPTP